MTETPTEKVLYEKRGEVANVTLDRPEKGVESAKDTILEVIGRPLEDQLRLEALYGYSIMGDPQIDAQRARFLAEGDPA